MKSAPVPDNPDESGIPAVVAQAIVHVDPRTLLHHPDNPNEGDIPAIIAAIRRVGYVDPVIVQESTGYAIAGNHRIDAAIELGMPTVPVIYVPFDDDEALAYLLANNQVGRRARYDDDKLLAALEKVNATPLGLDGTAFEPIDMELLRGTLDDPPPPPTVDGQKSETTRVAFDAAKTIVCPHCGESFDRP